MTGGLAIALAAPVAAAFPTALWCLRESHVRGRWFLAAALAVGLGLGTSSLTYFAWLALGLAGRGIPLPAWELPVFALLAAAFAWLHLRGPRPASIPPPEPPLPRRALIAVCAALLGVAACALTTFLLGLRVSPHGDLDAWAIWNMRARFLYRAPPASWHEYFAASPEWTHPDYPLLIPGAVARCWVYAGTDTTWAPRLVAALFTASTAGLLLAALAALRSPAQALVAVALLLGTGQFLSLGTAQYADVPLAFFLLAGVVLLALADRSGSAKPVTLAGLAAGLAAWTKNEGVVVLAALALVRALRAWRPGDGARMRRDVIAAALGAGPALLALAYFKLALAPPTDLFSHTSRAALWAHIADPARYGVILTYMARQMATIGPGVVVILAGYVLLLGRRPRPAGGAPVCAVLAVVLGADFIAYLTSYWEQVELHLAYSLDRLLMQVYPTALFAFFLFAATPEEALARRPPAGSADSSCPKGATNPER